MRRTKIVATLGPACAQEGVLGRMVQAGVDLFRINTSHGTPAEHEAYIRLVRDLARGLERPLGVVLDTQGPKVRVEELREPLEIREGEEVLLGEKGIPLSHVEAVTTARPGERVLIDDGRLSLEIVAVEGKALRCRVLRGGIVSSGKGVNFPDTELPIPALTPSDRRTLELAREMEVEYVALSFTKGPEDVREAKDILGERPAIIAKVELGVAVRRMEEIVAAADGAMVARGDLGVEIGPYRVPLIQKRLIEICNSRAKPVIVATQMLESMVNSPIPTRAEVSDVATAVRDGADAVMLSEETAVGRYPVEAVEAMARAAVAAEGGLPIQVPGLSPELVGQVPGACARAAVAVAGDVGAVAIISATISGWTARLVAALRPRIPVLAATPREEVARELSLVWGVVPLLIPATEGTDALTQVSLKAAREAGFVRPGDRVVITAGVPFWTPGTTNLIRVVTV